VHPPPRPLNGTRMPDGNSRSTPLREPVSRPRRLEALCALAADIAGMVEVERLWARVCASLDEVLGAGAAALHTPLLGAGCTWSAGEALPAGRLEEAAAGEGEGVVRLAGGGSALRLPLHSEGEALGTLVVGWAAAEAAGDDDLASVARLLAAQTAGALAGARAYARLSEAAYRRERFFSAMSHDLRTPITAIVGYSELLADGIVGELTAQQKEMVERISQVSGHLSQLVNDILDLAKLDAGRMEFHCQEVRLGDLVDEALVVVQPQAGSKSLGLRVELGEAAGRDVCVDAPRVRQILVNLLSNAVKFTERGEVVVTAGSAGAGSWIEVRDTGPGLPPGSEEAVFEEFLQIAAGNESKGEPGSGLGLAISRRLARAMGGDLRARSEAGAGAAFTLVLPPPPAHGRSA
jgi:signal transduction histidine kinase